MFVLIRAVAVVAFCFVTSCAQSTETPPLVKEINDDNTRAKKMMYEAERTRAVAKEKGEAGDTSERARLITEASKTYGAVSKLLLKMADKADELAKLRNPEWYAEYFSLHSKRFRNLATMAAGSERELLIRRDGSPTDAQLKSWKEELQGMKKEHDELDKKLSAIEARQGVVLIPD